MKILFTLVSIDCGKKMYLSSAKRLINELLSKTKHDILLSTNNLNFFSEIKSERFNIRDNIDRNCKFTYGSEFNYNLKYFAFEKIPLIYDYIIYLDCDIKLTKWDSKSDSFFTETMKNYEFGADRLNCVLKDEVNSFMKKNNCLFKHKISSYDILKRYKITDDIMNSKLPSEHFLIIKNDSVKIKKFHEKWKELNSYLENKNGLGGSWGDGFEIGISARYAGLNNQINLSTNYWVEVLGLQFNGNKF